MPHGPRPVCQFVESIDDAAPVRLDLSDEANFEIGRWSLPIPPLRREVSTNPFDDGGRVPSSAYDLRSLNFQVTPVGGSFDMYAATMPALAANLAALQRELNRPTNILRWKVPGMTNPVYFRTFRSPNHDYTQSFYAATAPTELEILAEPFAYRPRVTLPDYTITNDPAAVVVQGGGVLRRQYVDIDGVLGVVDTPALVELRFPTVRGVGKEYVIAMRQRGNPAALDQMAVQAEAMTAGTDTSTISDTSFSGGSGRRITFATNNTLTVARLTSSAAATLIPGSVTLSPEYRGLYRLYAYLRVNDTPMESQFQVQASLGVADGIFTTTEAVTHAPDTNSRRRVDLGVIQLPPVEDPEFVGPSGVSLGVTQHVLRLHAARTAGDGTLDVDYLRLVPADETLATIAATLGSTPLDERLLVDAFSQVVFYGRLDGPSIQARQNPEWLGGLPSLVPGVTNRMYLLAQDNSVTTPRQDSILRETVVSVSYWPRYLHAEG